MPELLRRDSPSLAMRRVSIGVGVTACLALLAGAPSALGQPVLWSSTEGGNNHWYEVIAVPGGITWSNASLAATNRGGYLATATASNENAFIFAVANQQPTAWNNGWGPWLGGVQRPGSQEPAGGWAWVTGEPFAYSNWAPSQPNNTGSGEDRIHFGGLAAASAAWNDLGQTNTNFARSFVVEYDPPAAVLMMGASVTGSASPPQTLGAPVTNGGFVITNCCPLTPTGDGIDEFTLWRFDFTAEENLRPFLEPTELSSALLTLTLTPKRSSIESDSVRIESFPPITPAIFRSLPAGVTTNIQVELLNHYSSRQIVGFLQDTGGVLPMHYQRDALISSATLELSRPDLRLRLRLRRSDGLLQICWSSELNKKYQVQFRTDLPGSSWVNLASSVLGNGVTNCLNTTQQSPAGLFRVVRLP